MDPAFPSATATRTVDENAPAGTNVGAPVTATETDVGDSVTYALSGTNAGSFDVASATGQITVGSGTDLDYETKDQYSVTVTARDTHGGTDSVTVTIDVNDVDEAGLLGSIVFVVGSSGDDYGYDSGSYGSLTSGEFPRGLFDDDTARTVEAIYENADAEWVLEYTGGTANDWLSDEDALNAITVSVTYSDGVDTRSLVLGGFIESVGSNNRIVLEPPLPSRDWDSRDTESIRLDFHRHAGQATSAVVTQITAPTAAPNSMVAFISDTTPGGPVVAQNLIVLLVYALWMWKGAQTVQSLMIGGFILVLTPWVPLMFGMGDPIAAVINFVNVLLGAYVYKYYFEAKEQYE